MDYALLPFRPIDLKLREKSFPDIRASLSSHQREVAENAIDNLELLDHVVESLRKLPWDYAVDFCHEQDGLLQLAITAPRLGKGLEQDDELNAGFYLSNCEQGRSDTLACTRIYRVVCSNGAILECDSDQHFVVAQAQQPPLDWKQKMSMVIERSFHNNWLDLDVARFRATIDQMIISPYELLCHLAAQGLIDEEEQCQIQAAFDDACDYTMYGFINAVTQVAHGLRSNDEWLRAMYFERLGGELIRGDHTLPSWDLSPV